MLAQAIVVRLEPAPEPLLVLRAVEIGGPLYMAGLANEKVPVLASHVPLAEGSVQAVVSAKEDNFSGGDIIVRPVESEEICSELRMEVSIEREEDRYDSNDLERGDVDDEEEEDDQDEEEVDNFNDSADLEDGEKEDGNYSESVGEEEDLDGLEDIDSAKAATNDPSSQPFSAQATTTAEATGDSTNKVASVNKSTFLFRRCAPLLLMSGRALRRTSTTARCKCL